MSAPRPRPVTATVRRPKPNASYKTRSSVSLSSSTGSTESLISCVYDEPLTVDDFEREESLQNAKLNKNGNNAENAYPHECKGKAEDTDNNSEQVNLRKNNNDSCNMYEPSSLHSREKATCIKKRKVMKPLNVMRNEMHGSENLGAWEQWMIEKLEKMKILEEKRKKEMELELKKKEETEQENKIKAQRLKQSFETRLKTMEEKIKRAERRKELKENKKKLEIEAKKTAWEEEEKARNKEVLRLRRKEEADRKEQEQLKAQELQKKKEESDEAFRVWLEKTAERARSSQKSNSLRDQSPFGYDSGVRNSSPSFYNPIPWQPVYPTDPTQTKAPRKGRRQKRDAWSVEG